MELDSGLRGRDAIALEGAVTCAGVKPGATAAKDISRIKGDPTLKVKLSKVITYPKRDGRM